MGDAEFIAERFHISYEMLAGIHGYRTRAETRVLWDDLPANNKSLMIATVQLLLDMEIIKRGD